MENQKKGSKALVAGVIGAVVVLAVVLVLLLTQCTGGEVAVPSTGATTAATEPVAETYQIYWNLDREEYHRKSEAGLSSRPMGADGFFSFRLFLDGQEVTLKTADRKLVNKIDSMALFGVVLDENGLIADVLDVEEMPLETPGWSFYVQSVGGSTIKLNSSDTFAGMEVLLQGDENTQIYDMTGMSGEVGCKATPASGDRVYPIVDLAGNVTHVFLYDRSNYMLTHQAECQHCKESVTWSEWTKTDDFPTKPGHYKLMVDVQMKGQVSLASDVKMCLDLNGHTVVGKENTRLVSLHNPGVTFALMDTSEAKTGRMVGHSTASPQGGIVWVRYGQFHMYGGTLDGSDMVSRLNGTVVQVPKNAFFYMYDGEIIGGTAAPQYNQETKKWTYGLGGSLQIAGTMRMYGGTIRDGSAPAAYYYNKGKLTLSRGMGGNIFLSSGSVMEMTGGQILGGHAGNVGANIMMDGTAQLIIKGGIISGGYIDGKVAGKNGGNIYCGSKATIEMSGGKLEYGWARSGGGGNIYLAGKMTFSGGYIACGMAGTTGGNVMVTSTGHLYMSAGIMYEGEATGEAAGYGGGNISLVSDKAKVTLVGGVIRDGKAIGLVNEDGTTVGGDGGNININRGTLVCRGGAIHGGEATGNGDGIYVGWNSAGMTLSQRTLIYDNGDVDICRSANTTAGKSSVRLGTWRGNGEGKRPTVIDRIQGVAGSLVIDPMEGTTLTEGDLANFTSSRRVLPLELTGKGTINYAAKATLGEPDHIHCLCAGNVSHTCSDTGFVSVTAEEFAECWSVGTSANSLMGSLNICLAEDATISTEYAMSGGVLNLCLHGHTITMEGNARLTANGGCGELNITDCTGSGKILAAENCRASFLYTYKGQINLYNGTVDASDLGKGYGALRVGYADDVINMYGGTVIGSKNASTGGSVYIGAAGTFNLYGGTIRDGVASGGGGGNIFVAHDGAVVNICGGTIRGGQATGTAKGSGLGGNIHVVRGALNISGGTIRGGVSKGLTDNGEPVGITGGIYVAYHAKAFTLSGNAKIYGNTGSDIWLTSLASYVVSLDNWKGNGGMDLVIGKTAGKAGSLLAEGKSGALTKANVEDFVSGCSGLDVKLSGGKLTLAAPFVHDHCICAGKVEGHSCTTTGFAEVQDLYDFEKLFTDGVLSGSVSIALTGDITLSREYTLGGNTLNLCLNGHTITMSGSGRITANGSGELNITDCGSGKIVAAEGAATSFLFTHKGRLNIYAGTVDATKTAAAAGGAIRVNQAGDVFNLYGGTIIGSQKGTTGGAVYMTNNGTINIRGGVITGGVGTSAGGNIALAHGTLNLYGGTISGGSAANGGNIMASNDAVVINIYGGTVTGGSATTAEKAKGLGGNIHIVRGALNISGGVITGGTAEGWPDDNIPAGTTGGIYLAYNAKAFTLSGDAKIYGNGGSDVWLTSKASYVITVDGWKGNGSNGALVVGKTGAAAGTLIASGKTALTESDLGKFTCDYAGMKLALNAEGSIVLEEIKYHQHCICDGILAGTDGHTCKAVTFTEIATTEEFIALFDSEKTLKANATIVLTGDIQLSGEYKLGGKTLNICLNGHTVALGSGGRITANGETGELNITDCGKGTIKGESNGFLYGYTGDINLYGGTVDASAISLSLSGGKYGGAVYMNKAGDTFTMYGGTVIGGTLERGGAVFAQYGSVVIRGGMITGGKAKYGGGVGVNFGTFEMTGGQITGNNATTNGAGVFLGYNMTTKGILGGNAAIYGNTGCEDVWLGQKNADDNRFVLDGWTGCGAGRTMTLSSASGKDGAVVAEAKTGTVSAAQLASMASYDQDYGLQINGDGQAALKQLHKHCVCNGKVTGSDAHTCKVLTYTEVDAAGFLALFGTDKKLTASHSVVLTEDVTMDAEYTLNGNTLDLCLNGHTITMTGNGRLTANGTSGVLNITDCGSGKIVAAEGTRTSFLYVYKGVMNLYGGTVDATESAAGNGGAITVGYAGDKLNIFGGTIIGSRKGSSGGSIYMAVNGTITMYGGTVKDGKATAGGGNLRLEAGEAYIKGGTISGGIAACGGNIHVYKTAKLSVEGGTITGGQSNGTKGGYGGGNIYLGDGAVTTGSVTISGGTISNGTSGLEGGNINVNRGSLTVTGGTITGGTSGVTGGGIYVGWNGTGVTISGTALIYGNTGTDISRCANTSTSLGRLLLGDWAGNGEHGAAKLDSLFTATGKTVIAPASGYTLTEADLAKFECVGTYKLALSGGKFVTAAK